MTIRFRSPLMQDLPALSDLCLRSKAHWGYDKAFMEACREELTLTVDTLESDHLRMAEDLRGPVGLAQIHIDGQTADLEKLFIDPRSFGERLGWRLFAWGVAVARQEGAKVLQTASDPNAEGFYKRMGCRRDGGIASVSIRGSVLPRMVLDLDTYSSPGA